MSEDIEADSVARDRKLADRMAIVIVLAGMIAGGVFGFNSETDIMADGVAKAIYVACGLVGAVGLAVGSGPYWRVIGEPARRNHLDAWFWGGSLGFAVMGTAIALIALDVISVDLPIADLTPEQLLGVGAGALAIAALAGYALHWIMLTLSRKAV